ncbi:MAG: GIY-YIG nuclease family protein [Ignavibacteriales bacterium]|nr:GIY-YIG nuclease family protein [Ignavibacteriales bacterium]
MKQGWVYILECSDGSYYTGSTSNIEKRLSEHHLGIYPGYTSRKRPVKLLWSEHFSEIKFAIAAERQIKGWTRKKKEALMRGDFDTLVELSKSRKSPDTRKQIKQSP